ncbi:MAG: PQQ-dependent sugar dehydrogenase [Maribacter sp.]|nr:PQQ-dependent sugar dehydrogenase [Maribacter sp.]
MHRIQKFTFIVFLLIVFGCFYSCKEKVETKMNYTSLSEKEKRQPENAIASMNLAEGLELELFASEPMVTNPTNMAIDARGRIWVCEGRNYRLFANPDNTYDDEGDRILILEDTNGDGKADTSKVFYQGTDVNSALGIAVLGNKVIVSVSPNVFVFTDTNGDDIPDSKEVMFTGIEGEDHDHGVHAFVFGPDGRLYFNFGNNGGQLMDKNGNPIKDILGIDIKNVGQPYREGMAFRCELDGSNVEVLGYNFRNPYELALDSYGGIWQSDNDDDGNFGTRINYLMEYGNYGFKDMLTGDNWRVRRTNWHEEIPKRHWHLNDPGTVPNLLQTGSGSPCGMLIYEDRLLPELYHNQIIHAEPGHNVVRSYIVNEKDGGYEARIHNLVKSDDDWFRPDDVTVAPDGSLFISDWYDGGVGGHKAEDISRGRIYRLSTGQSYNPTQFEVETAEGASKGLVSDNMDVFYQSWQKMNSMGKDAEPYLKELIEEGGTAKARALWLGAKISEKRGEYINMALSDNDAKFRIQGIRMARYVHKANLEDYIASVVNDSSPQVRREAVIALRYLGTPKAAELWAALADQHTKGDRWYLEALGIGSDHYPDVYFNAWKTKIGDNWLSPQGKEIVWRAKSTSTVPLLLEMIKDQKVQDDDLLSYFRAIGFKEHAKKNELLLSLLDIEHPLASRIQANVIGQLDEDFVNNSQRNKKLVQNLLPKIEGTSEWIMSLKRLKVKNQEKALFRVVADTNVDEDIRKEAASLLFDWDGADLVEGFLASDAPETDKMNVLGMLNTIKNKQAIDLLTKSITNETLGSALKQRAVEVLGNTWEGQHKLFALLEEGKLPDAYKTTAVLKLMTSWNSKIREQAPKFLGELGDENINIDALVERSGDILSGGEIYKMYCSSCHVVGDMGVEFGPALTDIGNKLSKQFLYSNIIYPSAGINFGYEGYTVDMKDGKTYTGYVLSRTEDELTLKMMGNTQITINRSDMEQIKAMDQSLMTQGLHKVMSEDDLIDLVEYLGTLKVDEKEVASN